MAANGRTGKITVTADKADQEFAGSGVEAQKGGSEVVRIEDVLKRLREEGKQV